MKMKAMWFFCDDWIADTRGMTPQQRGIFIDLLCYSHGKGLPNDIDELCRMVINYVPDLAKMEELRGDLIKVIKDKYTLIDNKYVNLRQQEEFAKGLELSTKRSNARKKKFDSVLLQQNPNNVDGDGDRDGDRDIDNNIYNINKKKRSTLSYSNDFEELWTTLSTENKTRSSKPNSFKAYQSLTKEDKHLVRKNWKDYQSEQAKENGNFAKALERYIKAETFRVSSNQEERIYKPIPEVVNND
jgi:uncharacterized protein YdaU (DUF1376 family)